MSHTLVLLRHAKSDYPPGIPDHERPLAPRGEREAVLAGRWLSEHVATIDLAVVSTATRTQQTWALVVPELPARPAERDEPRIYEAMTRDLLDVVRETDESVRTLLLVGHNPGLEDLAGLLSGRGRDDALERLRSKFPTSAIAVLEVNGPWSAVEPGGAELVAFTVPRG